MKVRRALQRGVSWDRYRWWLQQLNSIPELRFCLTLGTLTWIIFMWANAYHQLMLFSIQLLFIAALLQRKSHVLVTKEMVLWPSFLIPPHQRGEWMTLTLTITITNGTHALTCHCTQHLVINLSKATGLQILMVCPHFGQDDFILGELVASRILFDTHVKVLLVTGEAVSVWATLLFSS